MSAPARLAAPLPPMPLGASWSQTFELYGQDDSDPRTPAGIRMHLARRDRRPLAAEEIIVLSSDNGAVQIDGNRFTITRTPAQSADYVAGLYEFQLVEVDGAAQWVRLVGVISLEAGPVLAEAGDLTGPPLTGATAGQGTVALYLSETIRVAIGPGDTPGLVSRVSVEEVTRAFADASLTARLSAEEVTRAVADTSLTSRVSTEEVALASADTSLTTRVSTEEGARATADTSLTSRLSTEEAARSSADASLASALSTGDASLTTRVSTEEAARSVGDTSLTTRLSTEESARGSADASLTSRVSTQEAASLTRNGYYQASSLYHTGGGTVRQTTLAGGWSFVDDAAHDPFGWDASTPISVSGGNLVWDYDVTVAAVGAMYLQPDETYAAFGLTLGASVGTGVAVAYGFAPLSGRVAAGANGILYSGPSGNVTSQTVDQAAGTITIVHGGQTHADSNGTAVKVSPVANPAVGRLAVLSQSKTGFVLQYVRDLACRIACTDTTPGAEVFTVTENTIIGPVSAAWISATNCVRVTYPASGSPNPSAIVMLSRDAPTRYMFTLDAQGNTTCDIFFYDTSGALITAATSSMVFYFIKSGNYPAAIPSGSTLLGTVQRDLVPVNFTNLYDSRGNIWGGYTHRINP